jgi:hypothetical protein
MDMISEMWIFFSVPFRAFLYIKHFLNIPTNCTPLLFIYVVPEVGIYNTEICGRDVIENV